MSTPVSKKLTTTLLLAGHALNEVRIIASKLKEKVGRGPDQRLKPEIAQQEIETAKEHAKRDAKKWLEDNDTLKTIDAVLDEQEAYTLGVFVRKAAIIRTGD